MTNTETATPRRRSYKIWHLTRKDDYGYGTNIEFVPATRPESPTDMYGLTRASRT
jgi:hypothetical protein